MIFFRVIGKVTEAGKYPKLYRKCSETMITTTKSINYVNRPIISRGLFFLCIFLLIVSPVWAQITQICILYTNDLHGHMLPARDFLAPGEPKPVLGGLATLATYIEQVKAEAKNKDFEVFLFDSGDIFHGTPEGNVHKGKSIIKAMNLLGYHAIAVGNHEFAFGVENLRKVIAEAKIPFLSCNILDSFSRKFPEWLKPSLLLEVGQIKIGVIGVITPRTPHMNYPHHLEGLEFIAPETAVSPLVTNLREQGADLVVVLSHLGLEEDRILAAKIPDIDIIIGGHSHDIIDPPLRVGKTLICQAGCNGQRIGRLDLWLNDEDKSIMDYENTVNNLYTWEYKPNPQMQRLVSKFIISGMDEIVGCSQSTFWPEPYTESPLGDLVTDAMREALEADIAIESSAGLRCGLGKGDITLRDLYNVTPFGNTLFVVKLKGRQIKELIRNKISKGRCYIQVSGLRIIYDETLKSNRCLDIWVKGKRLQNGKTYKVVISNYLAQVDKDFKKILALCSEKDKYNTSIMIYEALENYVRKHVPLRRMPMNRIVLNMTRF